jgi:hypothetical protein
MTFVPIQPCDDFIYLPDAKLAKINLLFLKPFLFDHDQFNSCKETLKLAHGIIDWQTETRTPDPGMHDWYLL